MEAAPQPPVPEVQERVEKPVERQPEAAGFCPEKLAAAPAAQKLRRVETPRFVLGKPVWSGLVSAGAIALDGPAPRTAQHVADAPPTPRPSADQMRRLDVSAYRRPTRRFLLEKRLVERLRAHRPQPASASFFYTRFDPINAARKFRRPASPRFTPLPQAGAKNASVPPNRLGKVGVRSAKFVAGAAPPGRKGASELRRMPVAPRWKALEPALPESEPGKITLVLGRLLEQPARLAAQDRIPDTFEIAFEPASFPPYIPRMGSLEERLHRTDRIGFSPP